MTEIDFRANNINLTKIKNYLKKYKDVIKILVTIIIVAFVYNMAKKEFNKENMEAAIYYLKKSNIKEILYLVLSGMIAVITMVAYDYFLVKEMNLKVSFKRIIKISWISSTFNNLFNFGGITGAGTRILLYRKKNSSEKNSISNFLILFTSTATGLSFLSLLSLIGLLGNGDLFLENRLYFWVRIIFVMYIPVYFMLGKIKNLKKLFVKKEEKEVIQECHEKNDIIIRLKFFIASIIEWLFAGVFFFIVISKLNDNVSIAQSIDIFTSSAALGIISFIPGGIGSFDLAALLQLKALGMGAKEATIAIILFRIFYYFLPWIIGVLLAIHESFFRKDGGKLKYDYEE